MKKTTGCTEMNGDKKGQRYAELGFLRPLASRCPACPATEGSPEVNRGKQDEASSRNSHKGILSLLRPYTPRPKIASMGAAWALRPKNLFFGWLRYSRRGQQVLEYAIFIGTLAMVLSAMYMYSKRGLQAVIKGASDQIAPQITSQPPSGLSITDSTTSMDTFSKSSQSAKRSDNGIYTTETESASFSSGATDSVTTQY